MSNFVELPLNSDGRDFVVGDVHGHKSLLESLLEAVGFDTGCDRLIALGDLIDRGPESPATLRMVRDAPWMVSLMGNHEAMLIDALVDGHSEQIWRMNGGGWANSREALRDYAAIAEGLPLAIEWPLPDGRRIGAVHADVPPGTDWQTVRALAARTGRDDVEPFLWGRTRVVADARARAVEPDDARAGARVRTWEAMQPVAGIERIYTGHTVLEPPLPRGRANVVFLETGGYLKSGRMTLVEVATGRCWQTGRKDADVIGPETLPEPDPPDERWRPDDTTLENARQEGAEMLDLLRLLG